LPSVVPQLQGCAPCLSALDFVRLHSSLSDNQFTGDFPSSITTLTRLTLLYVQATFSLGESLGHAANPHEPFFTLAIVGSESGFRHWLQGACGQQF
jgi:hypothetical protein